MEGWGQAGNLNETVETEILIHVLKVITLTKPTRKIEIKRTAEHTTQQEDHRPHTRARALLTERKETAGEETGDSKGLSITKLSRGDRKTKGK